MKMKVPVGGQRKTSYFDVQNQIMIEEIRSCQTILCYNLILSFQWCQYQNRLKQNMILKNQFYVMSKSDVVFLNIWWNLILAEIYFRSVNLLLTCSIAGFACFFLWSSIVGISCVAESYVNNNCVRKQDRCTVYGRYKSVKKYKE